MLNNPVTKEALAPLLLRLSLAAVFIYHGLLKIAPVDKNEWGATWATHLWERLGSIPPDLKSRLDKMEPSDEQRKVRTQVEGLYREEGKKDLPPALAGHAAQFAVAWGELLGGITILLGFLTRLAALGLIIIQLGAIATVTWFQGFSIPETGGGYEFNLVLVGICLALLLMGGGTLSIDHWFVSRRKERAQQKTLTQQPMTSPTPTGV